MEYILPAVTTLIIIMALILIIRGIWETHHFIIREYEIISEKLKGADIRIVMLSDLHGRSYGRGNSLLLDAIHDTYPDCMIIAGDMIVGSEKADHAKTAEFIAALASKYPVYYGHGNHESRIGRSGNSLMRYKEAILEKISRSGKENHAGIYFLENGRAGFNCEDRDCGNGNYEAGNCENNGGKIVIYGLEIDSGYYGKKTVKEMPDSYIEEKLGKPDNLAFNILIAHNPEYFDNYAAYGADLILSGHNHGGTVRLPRVGGVISTKYKLFPKYDKGVFKKNNSTMIVSGGIGSHTINFRLFNIPEVILIKLSG